MSPRSQEFIDQARDRAKLAQEAQRYVDGAAEFIAAIEEMLDAPN